MRNWVLAAAIAAACVSGSAGAQARTAAGLEGIYYGFREDVVNSRVYPDYYTFLADGRVFRGDPSEGFGRPIDWERECRYAECGTYSRRGGEIRVRMRTAAQELVFDLDGAGVLRKRGRTQSYRPMHILDGTRLSGTYGQVDTERGDTLVAITFTPDGRFRERGLLRHTAWAELGSASENRARQVVHSGAGTYAIRRGTLELRYDGGPTAYLLVVTPPAVAPSATPATVHVNRSRLERLR